MNIQAIDPPENTTKVKIRGFANLNKGWHFGEGVPPSKKLLQIAVNMSDRIAMSGFRSDAFPGIDGEIMLTVYRGEDYLEFSFETDGTVTFVREKGKKEIAYEENLTVDQAKKRLEAFGTEEIWKNLSGSSMAPTTTRQGRNSKVTHLRIHPVQGYQLFSSRASMPLEMEHAPIYAGIMMKGSPQPQSSFGQSKRRIYLTDSASSNIQVHPAMSAMAI